MSNATDVEQQDFPAKARGLSKWLPRLDRFSALSVLWKRFVSAGLVVIFLLAAQGVRADVTVSTPASASISPETAVTGGTGAFTTLTGPVIDEGVARDIGVGTIILNAPTGWEFDAATTPGVAVSTLNAPDSASLTIGTISITATALTINVTAQDRTAGGSIKAISRITVSNLKVRPLSTTFPATNPGLITKSGTSVFAGVSPASYGSLTETAPPGMSTQLAFGVQPTSIVSGGAIAPAVTVLVKDDFGNTVTTATNSITISSANTAFSGGTLTVSAVAGVATFSDLHPTTFGASRTLTASASALTGATSSAFSVMAPPVTLTSPTTGWTTLLKGTAFDYINDQQATAQDLELVGDPNHALFYTHYNDNGTATDTDDFILYRIRVSGSKSNTASTFSSGYVFLGFDVNNDSAIDLFLSATQRTTGEQRISLWSPGPGLNMSPSTTSITGEVPVVNLATSPSFIDFSPVTTTNDPAVADVNLNDAPLGTTGLSTGINDHFLSFKVPFNNTTPASDSLKEIAAAKGVALSTSTVFRYLLATSTQSNSLNSDIGGYKGGTKSRVTFAQEEALTPPLSVSNLLPVITSNGGGDTASVLVASGLDVTTVGGTDGDVDPIGYSISGGANAGLFTIDPTTGLLQFLSPPSPGTYVVVVKASDLQSVGGAPKDASSYDTQTITVTVPDLLELTPPSILSVTSSRLNGHYKAGEVIPVQVTFGEVVLVTGSPTIQLETGSSDQTVSYTSGSGTTTLTFLYTVAPGEVSMDLDYIATTALVLNSGTVKDAAGNNASLTLPAPGTPGSLGANKNLVIDTAAPSFSSATASGSTAVITLTDVNPLDAINGPTLSLFAATINGSNIGIASATVDSTGKTVTLVLESSAIAGDIVAVSYNDASGDDDAYVIQDLAGNDADNFTTGDINATPDTTAPRIINVSSYDEGGNLLNGHFREGATIQIRVEFSEVVTGSADAGLNLETGTSDQEAGNVMGPNSSVYTFTYTVQAGDASQDLDYIETASLMLWEGSITDLSGNEADLTLPVPSQPFSLGGNNDIVIDTTPPSWVSANVSGSTLTATFGDMNPLDSTNPPATSAFEVKVNGVIRSITQLSVDPSTRRVILTLDGSVSSGDAVLISYTDPSGDNDTAAVQDLAGNDAPSFTGQSVQNLSGDGTAPTLVSINDNDADNQVYVFSPMTYTVTFSEDIDGETVSLADFHNVGTAAVTLNSIQETAPGSGVFQVNLTAQTTGTIILEIPSGVVIRDPAWNALDTTTALQGGVSTVNVVKAPQTITFESLLDRVYGDAPFTLGATASSGLPVSYTVVSGPATVSGNTVTLTGVGTVVIRATQAGNEVYEAAPNVEQSFNVTKAPQTITFESLPNRVTGEGPFELGATASSGLPVTYTVVSGPATVIDNTVTLTGAGTVVIRATQAGNEFYEAAPNVEQSFVVYGSDPNVKINVRGNGISIHCNSLTPERFDHTDFGRVALSESVVITYRIENYGTGVLQLGGAPTVTLSGTNAADFSVTTQPATTSVAAGGFVTFTVTFTPSATGLRAAGVRISNNSSDRNPFLFAIQGTGAVDNTPINLTMNGGRVKDGASPEIVAGTFVAEPDLGPENTFTLADGDGDGDNVLFRIDGNVLKLLFTPNISTKPVYYIRVRVSEPGGAWFEKTFTVLVMQEVAQAGEYIIADRGPYASSGTIIVVNKDGTIQKILNTTIKDPYEIDTDEFGNVIVANYEHNSTKTLIEAGGGIYRINIQTGKETLLASGAPFVTPLGVKVETTGANAGKYIVADADANSFDGAVFRVDPSTGAKTQLATGFYYLQGLALAPNGDIYVSDVGTAPKIIKVDPTTNAKTTIASGGSLRFPVGMAVESNGESVVVADAIAKKIIRVSLPSGTQTVISAAPEFIQPTHVAINTDGNYLVTDGKVVTGTRRLFLVDKVTGAATPISLDGIFEQPRGITTVK